VRAITGLRLKLRLCWYYDLQYGSERIFRTGREGLQGNDENYRGHADARQVGCALWHLVGSGMTQLVKHAPPLNKKKPQRQAIAISLTTILHIARRS
jgi:hypothetical protein